MAKRMVHRRRLQTTAGEVSINLTPLIDCTFLLIVFFILSTHFSKLPQLLLHKPVDSQAQHKPEEANAPNRAIVSVISAEPPADDPAQWDIGRARAVEHYEVFTRRIPAGRVDRLEEELRSRKAEAEEMGFEKFFVEIRADWRVGYMHVEPVMQAAADAGIGNINITAERQ
jgi:biopolymer transport protein ExbD